VLSSIVEDCRDAARIVPPLLNVGELMIESYFSGLALIIVFWSRLQKTGECFEIVTKIISAGPEEVTVELFTILRRACAIQATGLAWD